MQSQTPPSKSLTYRPDIDGLRAVAVLGVVFYHAGLKVTGGYVGVDVFFVISGFLITSLIIKELRQGTFSILGFWERRARRILPALTVVVLAILVAGWFFLLPADYEVLGKQIIALAALSSNVKLWLESGYFAAAADEKPLLHTWSLSLEEQFYLLIPLLLWFLFRLRKSSWVPPFLTLVALASFALSVIGSYRAPAATFFLLPTRAWELAIGSLLALVVPVSKPIFREVMAWAGLAAIISTFFCYPPGIRFPGVSALPPVLGSALLIWTGIPIAGCHQPRANRLLATGPLVWIGLLSYSLYLWHWPLFAYCRYLSASTPPLYLRLALIAFSIILAWLSLCFVERPFRSRSLVRSRNVVFALSATAIAILVILSLSLWKFHGFTQRIPSEVQRAFSAKNDFSFVTNLKPSDIPDRLLRFGTPNVAPSVFLWGDSHAMAILPAVDAACKEAGISALGATSSATPPVIGWYYPSPSGLDKSSLPYNHAILDYIASAVHHNHISTVILAAKWGTYLDTANADHAFETALIHTIEELRKSGCRIIILQQVPKFPFDVPKTLALDMVWGRDSRLHAISMQNYDAASRTQTEIFSSISATTPNFIVLNPAPSLTDNTGSISPRDIDGPLYRDSDHLNVRGSLRLKHAFLKLLPPTNS